MPNLLRPQEHDVGWPSTPVLLSDLPTAAHLKHCIVAAVQVCEHLVDLCHLVGVLVHLSNHFPLYLHCHDVNIVKETAARVGIEDVDLTALCINLNHRTIYALSHREK